jgi:hypothetical protein
LSDAAKVSENVTYATFASYLSGKFGASRVGSQIDDIESDLARLREVAERAGASVTRIDRYIALLNEAGIQERSKLSWAELQGVLRQVRLEDAVDYVRGRAYTLRHAELSEQAKRSRVLLQQALDSDTDDYSKESQIDAA